MNRLEAAEKFIAWSIENGYKDIKVTYGKNKDKIFAKTTMITGYPNLKTIIITLRHHIEDVPPENYTNILMSLEDRAKWKEKEGPPS